MPRQVVRRSESWNDGGLSPSRCGRRAGGTSPAARALRRVLLRVDLHLAPRRRGQVDAQLVGEPHQVEQHVGHLVADLRQLLCRQPARLVFAQPLEVLEQLGRLDAERHRQVLRRVELIPVALVGEAAQRLGEFAQRVGGLGSVGVHQRGLVGGGGSEQ